MEDETYMRRNYLNCVCSFLCCQSQQQIDVVCNREMVYSISLARPQPKNHPYEKGVILDCYRTTPSQYDGHQQTTESGEACIRWDVKGHYSDVVFPDSTVSDAANYCRSLGSSYLWCYTPTSSSSWERCGIGKCADDSLTKCGQLTIEQPTILGRNVTFTFTADTDNSNAIVEWQRKNGEHSWQTLPFKYNFTQYSQDWTYYLILTDSVRNAEVIYRVHYYNESIHCLMETPKLALQDISGYPCGFVRLRSEKVKENEKVEIEFYPSKNLTDIPESFERQWMLYKNQKTIPIVMKTNVYEEEMEPNDKYILTISKIHENITGRYGVYCGETEGSSNNVTVEIPVAPSAPVFEGLQDIEDCKGCIVGEDGDHFSVVCKTSGGTEPVTVSMSIGQYPLHTNQYNNTGTYYISFFVLYNSHHMLPLTCSVTNEALKSPLNAVARLYVIKSPTIQTFTVPDILKEGDDVNITCIFSGGRPAPNVFLNISGTEVFSANKASDLKSSTYIAQLTTFKRIWNKENITCCRYSKWYENVNECSPPKQVNYLFPPSYIKLEVKVEEEPPHQVYAVCVVYDSNPVCEVNLSAPVGIIVSKRYKNNVRRPYGAWDTELAVNLKVSKDDNGKEIECSADCPDFVVDIKDKKSIFVPYAPVIEFNISGSVLNMSEGQHAHVQCSAQSFPASNISWVEQTSDEVTIRKECHLKTDCILTIEAYVTSQRRLVCQARYLQKNMSKALTVNIVEKDEQSYADRSTGDKSLIWSILVSCLVVIIVAVIVCLVARKIMGNEKAKLETNQVKFSADGARDNEGEVEDPLPGNFNVAAQSCDQSEVIYSQPDESEAAPSANETYSVVHKTEKQNPSTSGSKETKQAEHGHLLYADLEFDTTVAPSKTDVVRRRNSPTEYVAIDFVKTAAEQTKEREPVEAENVYANQ